MEQALLKCETIAAVFIIILGTVFHFVFELSGRLRLAGLFFPVNESVWEHLKLVLWPSLIFAAIQYFTSKHLPSSFWAAKTLGIYVSMLSIIIIFYLYTYLLGKNYLVLDILTFIASVILGQFITYRIMASGRIPAVLQNLAPALLAVLIFFFFLFTYCPPRLHLFKNPLNGKYGI